MINHNCKSTCNGCNVPTQSVFLPDIQSAILNFGAWDHNENEHYKKFLYFSELPNTVMALKI